MKNNRRLILSAAALLLVLALMGGLWYFTRPASAAGEKSFTVEVVHKDQSTKTFTYQTDAEYVGEVLLSEGLVKGEEGPYGLYITWVDGETADYSVDQSYWALYEGEEYATQSADQTVMEDGDHFRLVYTIG